MALRVAVVGAGVIGLAVALELAGRGHQVVVVERSKPGNGTSRTSFSWLNANGKLPPSYFELNHAGMAWFHQLASDGVERDWLRLEGRIHYASSDRARRTLEDRVRLMRGLGYPATEISRGQALRLEPDLLIPPTADIVLWPSEGSVAPEAWIREMVGRARGAGVEILRPAIVDAIDATPRHAELSIEGSTIRADVAIVCTGGWTGTLLAKAGTRLPMLPATKGGETLGLLGYTESIPAIIKRTISGDDLNVRPDLPSGRYVVQALDLDPDVSPEDQPDPSGPAAATMIERARRTIRGFGGAGLREVRVGRRSIPADGLTACGWVPGMTRAYVIVTHSGFTLAGVLGHLAANEIEGSTEARLADFRPSRFAQL